ncbi:MAG: TerB family tellurite resistance protein [Flavobacteriales bacterium]|jgi:uncharacterized tellurite resistance protein B-like protein|nr:TerB family tellurite resistance protein [Flavobacteriales bacterium]
MTEKEKLYETLGELLFVVAKADGVIQEEEKEALNQLLANHSAEHEIKWSFNYEANKNNSVEEVYKKAISFCQHYGPAPEYKEFLEAMKTIADATNGIAPQESKVINSFSNDLLERFQKDLAQ